VTLRARSSKLADVRDSLSGGGEGVRRQLVDEMKATDKQVRERILKEAGITPPALLPFENDTLVEICL